MAHLLAQHFVVFDEKVIDVTAKVSRIKVLSVGSERRTLSWMLSTTSPLVAWCGERLQKVGRGRARRHAGYAFREGRIPREEVYPRPQSVEAIAQGSPPGGVTSKL